MKYNSNQSKKNKQSRTRQMKQSLYKMKGCSKKMRTSKKYHGLGGKGSTLDLGGNFNLAYPYNGPVTLNPALAVTQTTPIYKANGGYKCPDGLESNNYKTPFVVTSNVNGVNPLYPNSGPLPNGFNFLNPITNQRGGDCGCSGGMIPMNGGRVIKHRLGCKCSMCRMNNMQMNGGGGCSTSNNGIPYPDGLVGKPFLNSSNLPGANGIPGDANYYLLNKYNDDVSRQMINIGANPPFLGFKGGRRIRHHKKNKQTRKQTGGTFSNFLGQDLINLGRQFTYSIGSAYNSLNGYAAPTNPLPWKGQLPNTSSLSTVKNI